MLCSSCCLYFREIPLYKELMAFSATWATLWISFWINVDIPLKIRHCKQKKNNEFHLIQKLYRHIAFQERLKNEEEDEFLIIIWHNNVKTIELVLSRYFLFDMLPMYCLLLSTQFFFSFIHLHWTFVYVYLNK